MYMADRTPLNKRLELLVDDVLDKQDQHGPIDIDNITAADRRRTGTSFGYNAQTGRLAVEMVHYKGKFGEFVLEVDIFPHEKGVMAHLYCPVCSTAEKPHNLRITSERKQIAWDKDRGLSVSNFACTWELPEAGAHQELADTQRSIIMKTENLCRWQVVIEDNVARDA